MKTHTDYLWMNTKKQKEIVSIINEVRKIVQKSGVKEGMVLVSAMHITAPVRNRENRAPRLAYARSEQAPSRGNIILRGAGECGIITQNSKLKSQK